jgi:hypothetical protein
MHAPERANQYSVALFAQCFATLAVFRSEPAFEAAYKVSVACETSFHDYYAVQCMHTPPLCSDFHQLACHYSTPHQCVADQQAGLPLSTGVMYAFSVRARCSAALCRWLLHT